MRKILFIFLVLFMSCDLLQNEQIIAGALRRANGQSWACIIDESHEPSGISEVEEKANCIKINYKFTAEKVLTFSANVDETLAGLGYTVGVSVGLEYAEIYIYRLQNGETILVAPDSIDSERGNIWVYGVYSGKKLIWDDKDRR